jgi:hypothetical protein
MNCVRPCWPPGLGHRRRQLWRTEDMKISSVVSSIHSSLKGRCKPARFLEFCSKKICRHVKVLRDEQDNLETVQTWLSASVYLTHDFLCVKLGDLFVSSYIGYATQFWVCFFFFCIFGCFIWQKGFARQWYKAGLRKQANSKVTGRRRRLAVMIWC